MAQKTLLQRTPQPGLNDTTPNKNAIVSYPSVNTTADADAQDDLEWDRAFAASQDTLARLAARSREHREAGRTKRIKS